MKICVLNGSPKGEISVTMQYVKYMQKKFPDVEFDIVHVAHTLPRLEKDAEAFGEVLERVAASDAVLWDFPLYVCLVHGNYKRFIELVFERDGAGAFEGKYAAALSTSIHFFDNTAHEYMHAVCDDLGMKYVGYFSAEMQDLLKDEGRKALMFFAEDFLRHIREQLPVPRLHAPVQYEARPFECAAGEKIDNSGVKILLISDITADTPNLAAMAEAFKDSFTSPIEHIDLNAVKIAGGCLGCMHCGYDNKCVYDGKDDIRMLYDEKMRGADAVVFALPIRDRYFSARFKTFTDRRFFHTHQPLLTGRQIAYIVSGPLSQNRNIAEICQASAELDEANLAGMVSDETADAGALVRALALRVTAMARAHYIRPQTFNGVGGHKLFRDAMYLDLKFTFRADYKYYKKHKKFDFPQKRRMQRIVVQGMSIMNKFAFFRNYVTKNMKTLMLQGFKKLDA